jgi:hypothetical protein
MTLVPKILIGSGFLLILLGLAWHFGGKFLPLGRLPGDIAIEKENFRFYFPIATSLLISLIGSLILYLIQLFRNH